MLPLTACHPLLARFEDPAIKLASFDVFDTTITRAVGDPMCVFQLVGTALQQRGVDISPDVFLHLRLAAERRTRSNRRGREVTLQEIYAEVAFALGREHEADALMAVELETEHSLVAPVPEMSELVDHARRRYGRVVYISDMYLPQDFLDERLRSFGLLEPGDRLYVSSTCGGWKGDGRLFRTVLENEKLRPRELLHFGNSLPVDVRSAERLGIRAFHYTPANPNASEEILNDYATHYGSTLSSLAGASRKVRLDAPQLCGEHRVVWDTGASLTGPLLLMHATWMLERAVQCGIKRLLFLARDAYLPFKVMQRVLEIRRDLGIEAHYVYGSRATYLPLGFTTFGEREWDSATTHGGAGYVTLSDLAQGLQLSRELLQPH
ncbi:MAG TPA: hypothetical protein VEA63_10080, partial [Opitutus sp.]|nr:hypothetical protein [Opitutus sp.]